MTYFEPADLTAATALLAEHPGAGVVAGGTDLVVGARSGKRALPGVLIGIHRLGALEGIQSAEGGLRIGALVTHRELEESPFVTQSWSAISDAAALVGSPATRHVGTVGGNVANASPAQELGSPFLIFDASVELASERGQRRVPYAAFITGPGRTSAEAGELVTAVMLPAAPRGGRAGSAYVRLEYRQAMEIAIVGAAALLRIDDSGRCIDVRVALTAVAPTCVRAVDAEDAVRGNTIDAELIERAAVAAVRSARPIDDVRASAEYRRAMVPVIVRRALTVAHRRVRAESN